jgi:hypothetical protein
MSNQTAQSETTEMTLKDLIASMQSVIGDAIPVQINMVSIECMYAHDAGHVSTVMCVTARQAQKG